MKKRRILSMALAVALSASVAVSFSGCGEDSKTTSSLSPEFLDYLKTAEFPVETDETLDCWSYRGGTAYGTWDPKEMPYLKNWEERTGIKVNWTFANTDVKQQFSVMIASGDLPDMVSYMWGVPTDFPGGPERALGDGYITPLNDLIDNYAPNIKAYLEGNDVAQRALRTDSGKYYYIPNYVTSKEKNGDVSNGFVFRKDWLDDLGLPVPETLDDWYQTLKAFKEKKGATAPLTVSYTNFGRGLTNPFDISLGKMNDNGKVFYSYASEPYREFLTEMNKWFKEGILDSNVATVDAKTIDANMLNDKSGAAHLWISGVRNLITSGREKNPKFSLVGVKAPVKERGELPVWAARDSMVYNSGFAISEKSTKKELAMKLMDYGFTTEGRELMQFGIEGETFKIENGEYVYTDLIMDNPDGLSLSGAKAVYIRNTHNIPLFTGYEGLRANYVAKDIYPECDEALINWGTINVEKRSGRGGGGTPSESETSEYARLQTEISTYATEMMLKFIVGQEPLENFDAYVAELDKRGLPRYLEMSQIMYDRYMARISQ